MNEQFDKETPEVMKFIYGMMRAKDGSYKLPVEKFTFAVDNIDQLQVFDPTNEYTLDNDMMTIIKKRRQLKALHGELAKLEDDFIRDRSIKKRDKIRQMLDDIKRYGASKQDIETLRQLINPQTLF